MRKSHCESDMRSVSHVMNYFKISGLDPGINYGTINKDTNKNCATDF